MHIDISIEFSFPHIKIAAAFAHKSRTVGEREVCGGVWQGWCHGKQMAKCFWQTAIYCRTSMQFSCSSLCSLKFAYYSTHKAIEMEMGMEIAGEGKQIKKKLLPNYIFVYLFTGFLNKPKLWNNGRRFRITLWMCWLWLCSFSKITQSCNWFMLTHKNHQLELQFAYL